MSDSSDPSRSVDQTKQINSDQDNQQDRHLDQARASLRQSIARHAEIMGQAKKSPEELQLPVDLKQDLDQLTALLDRLDNTMIRIAVFGLVSRGKSAVINALLGQKALQTGPLHGVTRWPRSVYWNPEFPKNGNQDCELKVELIDTPGLDEVDGQNRAEMAMEMSEQADLILFVVAGDITNTEYQALRQLRSAQKPIILAFNKIDLYPNQDRQTIYQNLQDFWNRTGDPESLQTLLSADDIVMVAADPAPLQVQNEWPDGTTTYDWETRIPQIDDLKQVLLNLIANEGRSLLALNAMRQARSTETILANKTIGLQRQAADQVIRRFAKSKALVVSLNPFAILDVLGGLITDWAMLWTLAKLYSLPLTGNQTGKLWTGVIQSSVALSITELGSSFMLGLGKSAAAAITVLESPAGIAAYASTMGAQALVASYGSHAVGRAFQVYLEQGFTGGPQGANTVIQDILQQVKTDTVLYRLREEFAPASGLESPDE